ncbi:MAG: cobalamin biosynthesis protein, partial [Azoarcus sp.]|nr:cobalamin biosynthesis protein [Azoarcus sp.]
MSAFTLIVFKLAAGLLLDRLFGEVRRFHPLVSFGRWTNGVEARVRNWSASRLAGLLAWALAVGPWLALALLVRGLHPLAHWPIDIALLYFALGG